MTGRPLVGLSCYREPATWGVWSTTADLLPGVYADAVLDAGAVPVLLPPTSRDDDRVHEDAAVAVGRLDGLVVAGGADVAPQRYGEAPHPRTSGWRDDRDRWELALLAAAGRVSLPVLGVCRGMQVMAVGAGGALEQHVPDRVGHERHNPGGDRFGTTAVTVREGTLLSRLVGDRAEVHCHHHQAVRAHPGYRAAAWAEDGTLEAMESPGRRFCLAVQWHPEMAADVGLFRGLVAAAAAHASGR